MNYRLTLNIVNKILNTCSDLINYPEKHSFAWLNLTIPFLEHSLTLCIYYCIIFINTITYYLQHQQSFGLPATGDNFLITHQRDFHWKEKVDSVKENYYSYQLHTLWQKSVNDIPSFHRDIWGTLPRSCSCQPCWSLVWISRTESHAADVLVGSKQVESWRPTLCIWQCIDYKFQVLLI